MKRANNSGEADELPATNPQEPEKFLPGMCEENEELNWARRQVPEERSGLRFVFRKTELHDKPPGSRSYRAATAPATSHLDQVVKELNGQIAALTDRPGPVKSRIDRAIDRPGHRLLTPKHPGES